jgi:hypothetical protein
MAAKKQSTTIPQTGKFIQYDRTTKDYACYLDGMLIGYAPNYSAGETLCNDTYYEQLSHASAPAVEPEPAIVVENIRRDAKGDLDWEKDMQPAQIAASELAYVDYRIGSNQGDEDTNDLVIVSVPVAGQDEEIKVLMLGRDEVPLSYIERTIANLQKLLADPRVQAARQPRPMKLAA